MEDEGGDDAGTREGSSKRRYGVHSTIREHPRCPEDLYQRRKYC